MNIIVLLGHPAHFHLYKNIINSLKQDGHTVYVLIKKKDILEELLQKANIPYVIIQSKERKSSKLSIIQVMLMRLWRIFWFTINHKIDILTGSSTEAAQIAWLLRRRSIVAGEDDAPIIPEFITLVKPFVDSYLAPTTCDMGKIQKKVTQYTGCQKLSYLHPNWFSPDKTVVEKYFSTDKPYFILRFAKLKAYHDLSAHAGGISTEIAQHIIDQLKPYGNIYITSERELEPQFEQYRLSINMLDIHHVMAFASIVIADSQTMSAESGILGTPFIRFNDFAGKIGYLRELEDVYQLGFGIRTNEVEKLYSAIDTLLNMPNREDIFQKRREKMLSEKIDVTAFFTWFIENYPESKKTMLQNPDYQFNFK